MSGEKYKENWKKTLSKEIPPDKMIKKAERDYKKYLRQKHRIMSKPSGGSVYSLCDTYGMVSGTLRWFVNHHLDNLRNLSELYPEDNRISPLIYECNSEVAKIDKERTFWRNRVDERERIY